MPKLGKPVAVLIALAALSCAVFALNRGQPLVRNGFVYARASENVIANGYDPRPVVADSELSYDKPIGFAWIASPLVAALGNHVGLMVASLLGVLAYLVGVWRFFVAFDPFGFTDRERALAIALAAFCPIVAYQAWSAHPDALFAALFLGVFTLTHRMLERVTGLRVALWAGAILAAVLLKNYGMVLIPCAGLYLLLNVRKLLENPSGRGGIVALTAVFVVVGAVVALGWTGHNPVMRFEGEGGGVGQYGRGDWWIASRGTLVQVGVTLLVNVHVALVFLVSRATLDRRLRAALASFPIPYVVGLFVFPTTFYNMRYFVPLLPFAALIAVAGARSFLPTVRRIVEVAWLVVAALLVVVFDVEAVHARVEPAIPRLQVNWIGVPLSLLDNLRMPQHRAEKAWLANLNAKVEPGGVVYMPDVRYYGDARQGVYERALLIRADIETRYVGSRAFAPSETRFWVQGWTRSLDLLRELGRVEDQGHGLVLVETGR